jgi:hypothetical protein
MMDKRTATSGIGFERSSGGERVKTPSNPQARLK